MQLPGYVRGPPASRADAVVAPEALAYRESALLLLDEHLGGPAASNMERFRRHVSASRAAMLLFPAAAAGQPADGEQQQAADGGDGGDGDQAGEAGGAADAVAAADGAEHAAPLAAAVLPE